MEDGLGRLDFFLVGVDLGSERFGVWDDGGGL